MAIPLQLIHLASDGDVILACGQQEDLTTHKILVSSIILRCGSSHFKTMLGPDFKEGRDLAQATDPLEIALKGDDPEAMVMLCRALHMQFVAVPDELTPTTLRALAIVVDKYDCSGALRYASESWVRKVAKSAAPCELPDVLCAAYHLQQAELFGDIGKSLVLKSEGPIIDLAGHESSSLSACIGQSSESIHFWLNKEKQAIQRDIHKWIEGDLAGRSSFCAIDIGDDDDADAEDQQPQCEKSAILVAVLLRGLSRVKVWPASAWLYKQRSVSSVLDGLRSLEFRAIDFDEMPDACDSEECCSDRPGTIRRLYAAKASRFDKSIVRLCYCCVRNGQDLDNECECVPEDKQGANTES
ncbi:hypothetical protein LTR10_005832 [Elasticomyces elasticus]|nr:hypothetical protein LTR10_005832 [Elasticomyces elasticus]KAK4965039.1 hypothetical protein LTR42_012457 [Elasticomyces elasticus]